MSRVSKKDSLDLVALQLGRRNAQSACGHLHRALNHLEAAAKAIGPIIGIPDETREAERLSVAVAEYLNRLESRIARLTQARVGPKLTDLAVAEEAIRRPVIRSHLRAHGAEWEPGH